MPPAKLLLVVAAALLDGEGRVLLSRRPDGKSLAGLWEFPGGKLEPGERPEDALVRELAEELGVTVDPGRLAPLTFVSHAYPDMHLLMPVYVCRTWSGVPHPREAQALHWATGDDLARMPMPPADVPLIPAVAALIGPLGT